MKTLRCREVGFDCAVVIRAETENEVLRQAAEHAKSAHYVSEMSGQAAEKMRAVIRDEPQVRTRSHRAEPSSGKP